VRYLIGRIVERLVFDRYADAAASRKPRSSRSE
jgi:hypothetical protein